MDSSPPAAPITPVESEGRSSSGDQSIIAPVEFGTAIMALANRAVDAVSGRSRTNIKLEEEVVPEAAAEAPAFTTAPGMGSGSDVDADADCNLHSKAFQDCLNSFEFDDIGKCQYYMDMLAVCCRNSSC